MTVDPARAIGVISLKSYFYDLFRYDKGWFGPTPIPAPTSELGGGRLTAEPDIRVRPGL